jgi:oxygen-dependent protoporphyrinogen oxidase
MRVAIVGGGLTGLTVAFRRARAGDEVTLLEAGDRLGGQLWTAREDGFVVELGAEGFVARSEVVPALAGDVGIAEELLGQRATVSFFYDGDALVRLAPGEAAEALRFQVSAADKGAGIRTFVHGMQSLSDALERAIADSRQAVDLRRGRTVLAIEPTDSGVRVDGEPYDAVVLATSAAAAGKLVAPLVDAAPIASAETLSSVTVSLAYDASQVRHPLEGTGFVVHAPFEGFRACTFTSSKFAYRVPDGAVSLRVFFRPTKEELEAETPWAERAARVLGRVLPIDGPPRRAWVSAWANALPVFDDGYRAAVRGIEAELARRRIHLAGSAFHGSGIDAAVRSAEAVAARLPG